MRIYTYRHVSSAFIVFTLIISVAILAQAILAYLIHRRTVLLLLPLESMSLSMLGHSVARMLGEPRASVEYWWTLPFDDDSEKGSGSEAEEEEEAEEDEKENTCLKRLPARPFAKK